MFQACKVPSPEPSAQIKTKYLVMNCDRVQENMRGKNQAGFVMGLIPGYSYLIFRKDIELRLIDFA